MYVLPRKKNGMPTESLILHFDINKTVLMFDPKGLKGVKEAINSAIAESVVGYIDEKNNWIPADDILCKHPGRRCEKRW